MARPTKPKDVKPKAITDASISGSGGVGGDSKLDIKFIATILAIILVGLGGPAASVYFLAPLVVDPAIQAAIGSSGQHHGKEGSEGSHAGPNETLGLNLELDEFTVNLKTDPTLGGNQFLRTKMSLSVAVPEAEYCYPPGSAPGEGHAALPNSSTLESNDFRTALAGNPSYKGVIAGAAISLEHSGTRQNSENEEVGREERRSKRLLASGGTADPSGGYDACQKTFNQNMARYVPTLRDIINQALMKRTAGTLASVEGQETLKDEIKQQANQLMGDKYALIRVNFSDFIIQY